MMHNDVELFMILDGAIDTRLVSLQMIHVYMKSK